MRAAILAVLLEASSGITVTELKAGVLPLLPDALFPPAPRWAGGPRGQLDLEANGAIERVPASKPLRLRRAP